MFTNPVVISVIVMVVLCLFKLNVMLSLLIAAITGGLLAGLPLGETMGIMIEGMGGNAETAISYVLLGGLAAAIAKTGSAEALANQVSTSIKGKSYVLIISFVIAGILSQTAIPVHIAFVPILVPPLLSVMNKMKMDRRGAASTLVFGLKAPYIVLPAGYGLIFHNLIRDNMSESGMEISTGMVWQVAWIAGLAMLVGLFIALFVFRKPKHYEDVELEIEKKEEDTAAVTSHSKHVLVLLACVIALVVQVFTDSMPLGAIAGILTMIITRTIKWNEIEGVMFEGLKLMGMIAFIMLVAAGYAEVMRATGGIESLVDTASVMIGDSQFIAASVMIFVGLFITMGIGTSFGTIPVIATIYVPLALELGFSVNATILLIVVAASLGDAGSPASDSTLGTTAGLNADGQHDHIWDTCVPTFLCFNIPLIIFGVLGAVIL